MEEKQRIRRAAKGDTAAFEQLVIEHQAQVYNLALRMVGNDADAQDVTQEVFVRVWRTLDSFQFSSQFSTWLYRVASNACIDFLRAQKRNQAVSLTILQEDETQQWDMPDGQPLPEAQLILQEDREELAAAMASLDPEYRQILTLRILGDCSYQQIGEILHLREGTVKSRLSRAREQLRKKLIKYGNFSDTPSSNSQKRGRSDV